MLDLSVIYLSKQIVSYFHNEKEHSFEIDSHPRGITSSIFSNPSNLTFGGIFTSAGISSDLRPFGFTSSTAVFAYKISC